MKRYLIYYTLLFLLLMYSVTISYALNVETHEAINEYIASTTINSFSLNDYLNKNLGFAKGKDEVVKANGEEKEVYKWIKLGGRYEDKPPWTFPYLRSKNHFHNPINEQGFSGIWDTEFLAGMSATLWATLPKNFQSPGGFYSWDDVRNYYYLALTSSDKNLRDTNFSQTFRGIGQLMHLIQDMSVPEHSRNDGHYLPYVDYENWVMRWVNSYGVPIPDNNKGHFFSGPISSIKSFIDTDKYAGSNPEVTVYSTIGLSEFSNANFFSDDSIFTGFTYPSIAGASLWTDTTNNRQYLKKTTEGVPVEHLAVSSWLYFYRLQYFPQYNEKLPLGLDNNVYADYASLLLPRAVGYSAGLLNYFFRGNMDFTIDANDREDGVKGVKISNRSTEDMDGTFNLYYDTADTNRHLLGSWNITLPSQGASQILSFSLPQDYYKYKYTLAFRGKMGTEQDSVAGYQFTGWREEWNNGLHGNHTWLHSGIDFMLPYGPNGELIDLQNPLNGQTINEVAGGRLIKENIRYAGSEKPRINQTLIMDAFVNPLPSLYPYCIENIDYEYCRDYDFGEEFPIPLTKNTWISVKIDEININETIPYQNCSNGFYGPGSEQSIEIKFDNGYFLYFSIHGHEPNILVSPIFGGPDLEKHRVAYVELGKEWSYNIFATFRNAGIEFTEPANIKLIDTIQQLNPLCNPSTIEHRQRMVVDYIRIEERPTILQSQSIIVSP